MRVTKRDLENIKGDVRRESSPSSGNNLLGFQIDLDYALTSSEIFNRAKVKKTGDVNHLLRADCKVSGEAHAIEQVEGELARIWEWARYTHFEAHALTISENEITFDFVTVMGIEPLYVTGTVQVDLSNSKISARNQT